MVGLLQYLKAALRVGEFFGSPNIVSLDWGILANWSCVRMMQSQLLFLILENTSLRLAGVKSSLPG